MNTVTSKDGTQIAYDKKGQGPALILIDGALCYRGFGPMPGLAELLAPNFTVYTYDRRGRGQSSNGMPYTLDREIEDIDALIQAAGGTAYLYGISSGACLALETALKLGPKVAKLAMYEPPYNAQPGAMEQWKQYRKQLDQALSEGRRGDAVVLFMKLVGTPEDAVSGMRNSPMWPMFEAVAPTLAHDADDIGRDRSAPVDRAARLEVPTLVMDGGANLTMMPFMHDSATKLTKAIPHAQHRTLEGQTHDVKAEVIAPVLVEFFRS
jgi:pimeloyl-ACP methyl ester carboxylesterase